MARTLLLVPTSKEMRFVHSEYCAVEGVSIELCGFGPVVAAARTAQLLAKLAPEHVVLLGIAGSLCDQLRIGQAYEFNEVACFGVGAGAGQDYLTAGEMGWAHWPQEPAIGDVISLGGQGSECQLLTSCAAAGNEHDVELRLRKFPNAQAEDMEGFAVAAACRLASVPLRIIRGISNRAGDRDPRAWKIDLAMQSAVQLLRSRPQGL